MVLKQRRDGKMRKDITDFNSIVIILGLLYLMPFVTCESVCYTQISLDERNRRIQRVDCDGTEEICWRFASRKYVKLDDVLLNARCEYPEDPVTPITCSTTNLPTITNGAFDCAPNSDITKGNSCILICNDGFYPAYSNQTVCEAGTTYQGGVWSNGSFVCAITCSTTNLPTVTNGAFDCVPNSDKVNGNLCNLTCNDGFYPAYSNQTVCEAGTTHQGGVWSNGSFVCAITCSTTNLPTVKYGAFDCAPNSDLAKGNSCNLTCNDGFYPAYSNQTVCEEGTTFEGGVWSNGSFVCECNKWNQWNGRRYRFISTLQSWYRSRHLCESSSSHLVAIENKQEMEFIHDFLDMVWRCYESKETWIGLNDIDEEGAWRWSDGTVPTYTNWHQTEPDGGDAVNCVFTFASHGKWHDGDCRHQKNAICETNDIVS